MGRFVEGRHRQQAAFLPECLEDFVDPDNPVRVIDAFIDELDLLGLGFERAQPAATGRPAYHPAMLLKLYLYGYLNQVQSSRRLEREASRNVELMWLTGKLAPDFKTIADFRRDNADAITAVCRQYVGVCRGLGLLAGSFVAVDGSRFKGVNAREKNFTRAKLDKRRAEVEASITRYLAELDDADRAEREVAPAKVEQLGVKLARMRERLQQLKGIETKLEAAPDGQVSLTDPDSRAMATSTPGKGMVGYNLQAAVEAEHHLIVAHEVINTGSDRHQLATMAAQVQAAMGAGELTVVADRGYYDGEEVLACKQSGIAALVPKPETSPAKAQGRFSKQDFAYEPEHDSYRCPMGERLTNRCASLESGKTFRVYFNAAACRGCAAKARCTTGQERRIKRWEHEDVLDAMQQRLDNTPDAMALRRRTVEHPFGTLKHWMGVTPLLTKGLKNVGAELSLAVLAYNLKRTIGILGVQPLLAAIRA